MTDADDSQRKTDKELGMDRPITRRDFLDGVMIGTGAVLAGGWLAACTPGSSPLRSTGSSSPAAGPGGLAPGGQSAYPPDLTGLRGQTDAASTIPHQLRDGTFWPSAADPISTRETYDLVVVGAGISGLASAYFYSQSNPSARILLLDTNDDFGGHARRNEFHDVQGRPDGMLMSFGGGESIEAPKRWSPEAMSLLEGIGIDVERLIKYYDEGFYPYHSLSFFDKETWGRDHTAIITPWLPIKESLVGAPMAEQAKRDLNMLFENPPDWMPGLSDEQKKERLAQMTYLEFLTDVAKVHPDASKYLQNHAADDWGYGIDQQGAIDVWPSAPGFQGMGMDASKPSKYNSPSTQSLWNDNEPYHYHFPDGNAGIARLLVRSLIPEALPGSTMEDAVLATLDYGLLDLPGNRVQIRLNSPVVRVKNFGDPATEVEVTYVQGDQLQTVKAKGVVMACQYQMIPFILDDYPQAQKEAASFMGRVPLVYANVQLRNRRAFDKMKVWGGRWVGSGHDWITSYLDWPVSMGGYEYPTDLSEPGVLHLSGNPTVPGTPLRVGTVEGRQQLYGKSFADLERSIRDFLGRSMAPGGFDPAEDIQALTINRWPHGYSIEYVMPWDKDFYPDGPLPGEVASRPFGRVTFANTDRASVAYAHYTIDAAHTAVNEQLNLS